MQIARRIYLDERRKEIGDDSSCFMFLKASSNERVDLSELPIQPAFVDASDIVLGKSVNVLHAVITPLVQYFLNGLLKLTNEVWYRQVHFARSDSEDKRPQTTQENLPPDWMFFIKDVVVFRGEERGVSFGCTSEDAAQSLTSKMESWNPLFFGELPYVFGYALFGLSFQLYALHPDSSIRYAGGACGVQKTPLGKQINLAFINERFLLLQYMANLVRVLQVMEPLVPPDAPPIGEIQRPWKRDRNTEYSRIVFEPRFVKKTLISTSLGPAMYDFTALEALYGIVKTGKIRNTIRCRDGYPKRDGDNMELHLYPIGRPTVPRDEPSLNRCLTDVLTALNDLHENEFCHRDVRWPNILQNVDKSWMLIDLDFARKMQRKKGTVDWPTWTRCVPKRIGSEMWGARQDVIQVSFLLKELLWFRSRDALAAQVETCESASEALVVVQSFFGSN